MYKSRRILAPGEISEFNGSPMLQLIVQPASVENRMYQAEFKNLYQMPRIILRNNIKTISFELVNLPANFYSFVSFSCRHENGIRFNLFVRQKYIRKYFIVDNLELERIGEEGFFSFFQSLYRYIYICDFV